MHNSQFISDTLLSTVAKWQRIKLCAFFTGPLCVREVAAIIEQAVLFYNRCNFGGWYIVG